MDDEGALRKHLSRRAFLAGAGGFVAGAAVGGHLLGAVGLAAPTAAEIPAWPWPYVPLDPEVVRRKAYDAYSRGGCMYGAAEAILSELREKVGHPFTAIPSEMFRYGEGGVVGWSTLCGALNGASAVVNLVSDEKGYKAVVNELVGWYTETPLPTPQSNAFSETQVQTVAGSPLCHASVTLWCQASGFGATSKERAERCAKLTGDTAARAVELLNRRAAGSFVPAYGTPAGVTGCMSCHGKEGMDNTRGQMNCVQCHEPHD
ncbi:C-GCAxxG-C-C family protein [Limnochorda pilosa]|uniref:Split soret cytochrome c n=1 Tax=Limnochorda pilosa TaxID=1555112 RepID=A0A0K2SK35_LIMPI|nr:C-GCAxxG-C-C family protein [Limnochorda pilosa]BAS27189.1 split soret cytochrome c precursor [Limnochorda pilosa]